ncbi:MAG: hypothetical protein M3Y77_00495 [Actinomycetota bacterium]|nr:hypothetical protein [Actinomycetota bacterium]
MPPPIPTGCAGDDGDELVDECVAGAEVLRVLGSDVVGSGALVELCVVGASDVVGWVVGAGVVLRCELVDFGGTVMVVMVDPVVGALLDDFGAELAAELDDVPRPGTVTAGPLLGAAVDAGALDAELAAEDAVELTGSAVVAVPQAARPRAATQSRAGRRTDRCARMGPQCQ